ncbi:MAG: nucleotide exchange factor GrpE [Lentisphaerae bacterium RIFOXYA12_FULL_48_11]|nr:MAG: nucleotide exchange factor GrpE [Lentisphaerae bacterium RIFOXYA12_FULL_48_11]
MPDVKAESDDAKSVSESEAQGKSADLKAETSGKEGNDEKYLRLMADFDNFRKRTIRERTELYQRANEDIIEEILPVLDHLDLALKSAAENNVVAGVIDGFRLVAEQLLSALRKSGLTVLDVAEGSQFDPTLHEAISHLPSENIPENAVITQIRRGYLLGGRVLRATQVVVSRGSQSDGGQENVEPVISSEGK